MPVHVWITPEAVAERLQAHRFGKGWRAKCPVHGGENPASLAIEEGKDKHGIPCTMLYCHAHRCDIQDICTALDIDLVSLFCGSSAYRETMRHFPRGHDPRLERLRFWATEPTQDDLAQAMLESEIVNDAGFLSRVPAARETFWRLVQDQTRKPGLVKALIEAGLPIRTTLEALAQEWGG